MRPTILLSCLLIMAMLPWTTAQTPPPEEGVAYRLVLDCPGDSVQVTFCPVVAPDEQDAMGDPSLAVNPDLPSNMVIASLHGSPDNQNAPDDKARSGQAFTTFTTSDHGAFWTDNPFFPPQGVNGGYGITPALTIDPYGHVFVGSLYAIAQGNSGHFEYVIAAQKFRDLGDINANQNGNYRVEYIRSIYPGNEIKQMWFVFNPVTDNMTMLWSETTTQYSSGFESPQIADTLEEVLSDRRGLEDRITGALAGRQAQSTDVAKSTIGVVWSPGSIEADYHAQPVRHAIAPCSASTNPVISEGWLYVGCKVAEGEGEFRWRPDAEPGDIEMFRMDPDGGIPEYLGPSPLQGGMPKIGVRSDGRIALMTTDVVDGTLRLDAAYGTYQPASTLAPAFIQWSGVHQYGNSLEDVHPMLELQDSNIQDMIYREYSGVVHMIFKRVVEPGEDFVDNLAAQRFPRYQKAIVAIDEKYGVLAEMDLDIGNPINRSKDPTLMANSDAAYNDITDDFLELPPWYFEFENVPLGDHYMREFIAVGDYGVVIFAEVVELTDLRGPGIVPLVPAPPPPIPAPAAAAISSTAPAAALTVTALLSGSVATAKRKAATKAGFGKKKNPR